MGKQKFVHKSVLKTMSAALGVVLATSTLTAAPASGSGLLDIVSPVPGIDGIGTIDGPGDYLCSPPSDLAGIFECPPIPLDLLSLTQDTVLRAVETPGSGFEFDSWRNCPVPAGTVCTIPAGDLLGTVIKPIAEFVPVTGGGGGGGEEPGTTPVVTIDSWLPGEATTTDTTATFRFSMDPVAEGWTFECRLTDMAATPAAWSPCASGKTYPELAVGSYVFEVRGANPAADPATTAVDSESWTVEEESSGLPASVTIDSGPAHKSWLVQDFAQFRYTAEPTDGSVVCRLDGKVKQCSDDSVVLRSLSGRTHTFKVTAINAEGDWDTARRVFTVPRNNTQLRHSKGDWDRANARKAFRGTYSETDKRGSVLKAGAKKIKRIALVVTKAPGFGKVKVMLGKKVLKRVSLDAKRVRSSKLVPIETFRKRRSGVIKVVVTSRNKTVQIEGLGIATR